MTRRGQPPPSAPLVAPSGYTREDLIATVERELRLRERSYPKWVKLGQMSHAKMTAEIRAMRAVLAVVQQLPTVAPAQASLAGGQW